MWKESCWYRKFVYFLTKLSVIGVFILIFLEFEYLNNKLVKVTSVPVLYLPNSDIRQEQLYIHTLITCIFDSFFVT